LAAPIVELAGLLNLKPECYLTTLLTQISSLFKVGSEIKLRNDTNYRVTPNYFAGIVAESSQKKSPIMREIIDRPMQPLRERARRNLKKHRKLTRRNWQIGERPKERIKVLLQNHRAKNFTLSQRPQERGFSIK
jgi:hypothetical protein